MELLTKYKEKFSDIPSLYEYQKDVINKLNQKENTLAIIPTGGGKSLIYQLMALELIGITLVISPLLALMEEQVNELNDKRNIPSLALNSNISFLDQREILRNLDERYKLLYLSPERLQNPFFRASLISSGIKISMIVVDEAHCISQWGSSFRPDYGQINDFVMFLKAKNHNPFLLCLTATLSEIARNDIMAEFNIEKENVIIKDIIRTNLKLNFQEVKKEEEKANYLEDFLAKYNPQKTIAYLYSQRKCEEYADFFSDTYKAGFYHSGIDSDDKESIFHQFVKSELDILFATTAFGMGINIPDIDCVIHLQIPNSVEEYYQQVGRGWRRNDLQKVCQCLALWSEVNFDRRLKEMENEKLTTEKLQKAFDQLIGNARIKRIGQVVNKDKDGFSRSEYNLKLIRYKLEKYGIIKTVGETNGTPLTIELHKNTPLWDKIIGAAEEMDSFNFVSKLLIISIPEIIEHLYEQDLIGNIKKLPAMKRDVYFEILVLKMEESLKERIVKEINKEIDFKIERLLELKNLFTCDNSIEHITKLLS